jgi:hypothetical protein
VAAIYRAVAELEARYHPRKFTPDGHLVGSIGEVVAAEALGLTLYPMSHAGHDACDAEGEVQIKMTAGRSVAMYAECVRLVVLRVVSPEEAEIVYDGPGAPVWAVAGRVQKNGQRVVSLLVSQGCALSGAPHEPQAHSELGFEFNESAGYTVSPHIYHRRCSRQGRAPDYMKYLKS